MCRAPVNREQYALSPHSRRPYRSRHTEDYHCDVWVKAIDLFLIVSVTAPHVPDEHVCLSSLLSKRLISISKCPHKFFQLLIRGGSIKVLCTRLHVSDALLQGLSQGCLFRLDCLGRFTNTGHTQHLQCLCFGGPRMAEHPLGHLDLSLALLGGDMFAR